MRIDNLLINKENNYMKVFLFSGMHGVGKGVLLDKVKGKLLKYDIYSASQLIEQYQPSTDAGYKKVASVSNKQDVLIKALNEKKSQSVNDFIVDGHLCIFNSRGEVERIPEYFFCETGITGILLLQDNPQRIFERLQKRDSSSISINDITRVQDEERKYACDLQGKYRIRNVIISHECTDDQFVETLKEIGGDTDE